MCCGVDFFSCFSVFDNLIPISLKIFASICIKYELSAFKIQFAMPSDFDFFLVIFVVSRSVFSRDPLKCPISSVVDHVHVISACLLCVLYMVLQKPV